MLVTLWWLCCLLSFIRQKLQYYCVSNCQKPQNNPHSWKRGIKGNIFCNTLCKTIGMQNSSFTKKKRNKLNINQQLWTGNGNFWTTSHICGCTSACSCVRVSACVQTLICVPAMDEWRMCVYDVCMHIYIGASYVCMLKYNSDHMPVAKNTNKCLYIWVQNVYKTLTL